MTEFDVDITTAPGALTIDDDGGIAAVLAALDADPGLGGAGGSIGWHGDDSFSATATVEAESIAEAVTVAVPRFLHALAGVGVVAEVARVVAYPASNSDHDDRPDVGTA